MTASDRLKQLMLSWLIFMAILCVHMGIAGERLAGVLVACTLGWFAKLFLLPEESWWLRLISLAGLLTTLHWTIRATLSGGGS